MYIYENDVIQLFPPNLNSILCRTVILNHCVTTQLVFISKVRTLLVETFSNFLKITICSVKRRIVWNLG